MAVLNASSASSTALSSWPPRAAARPKTSAAVIIAKAPYFYVPLSPEIDTRRLDFPAADSALFLSPCVDRTYSPQGSEVIDEAPRGDGGSDGGGIGMRRRGGTSAGTEEGGADVRGLRGDEAR